MPQKNAEVYLNTTVYQLRKLLDAYGLKQVLHTDNNHYALNLTDITVDFLRFEEGCKMLSVIQSEEDIELARTLEQLYVGDLFGDNVYTWAWSEIERLSIVYTSLTRRLCLALLRVRDISSATLLLKKLLSRNELDEESLMLLLQALTIQKNKEALIEQYAHFTSQLLREIGTGPSPEASALYARLLSELE
ncbi:BTAD domain-containing putative transcriptional regulator [Paenibacillus sp. NPDC056933]|uniref:AfsR/SARP family transcriptional regulator n=1 Tax=Paenibacillus sp. NPDC056933 TaxID=3345968 RepID=UPI00362E2541